MKLAGKVGVMTGGSGIGLATAREFVANGAKVVIFGRNRATLDHAVIDLGEDTLAIEGDVRRTYDLERLLVMAKAAQYLASDGSAYCVRSEIVVDGGLVATCLSPLTPTKEKLMSTLFHSVPVNASPDKVYAAVATQAGMQGWWTRDSKMTPKVGGKAVFGFDDRQMVFRMTIDEMTPNRSIRMSCSGDHPDWQGTTLEWVIEPTAQGSELRFYQRDIRDITPFMAGCNSMWGNLLFRLKAFVETGKPNPQWTK